MLLALLLLPRSCGTSCTTVVDDRESGTKKSILIVFALVLELAEDTELDEWSRGDPLERSLLSRELDLDRTAGPDTVFADFDFLKVGDSSPLLLLRLNLLGKVDIFESDGLREMLLMLPISVEGEDLLLILLNAIFAAIDDADDDDRRSLVSGSVLLRTGAAIRDGLASGTAGGWRISGLSSTGGQFVVSCISGLWFIKTWAKEAVLFFLPSGEVFMEEIID